MQSDRQPNVQVPENNGLLLHPHRSNSGRERHVCGLSTNWSTDRRCGISKETVSRMDYSNKARPSQILPGYQALCWTYPAIFISICIRGEGGNGRLRASSKPIALPMALTHPLFVIRPVLTDHEKVQMQNVPYRSIPWAYCVFPPARPHT